MYKFRYRAHGLLTLPENCRGRARESDAGKLLSLFALSGESTWPIVYMAPIVVLGSLTFNHHCLLLCS